MRRAFCLLWVVVLSACAGGGAMHSTSALPDVSGSTTRVTDSTAASNTLLASHLWVVGTGASTYSYALQDLDFYPGSITIDAGDSIAYQIASGSGGDAHTVSFVPAGMTIPSPDNPNDLVPSGGTTIDGTKFVNSGILLGGQTFTLKFTKAGTYRILCLFHEPAMEGTVVVQNAGAPYPHTQSYYTSTGSTDLWEDLGAAQKSAALFPFKSFGTTIAAGISPGLTKFPPADSTILRYLNSASTDSSVLAREGSMSIKVGTTLTFMNETNNEPHTVTIVPAGQNDLPNMPPDPAKNAVAYPGVTTFDGTKVVNSGTLVRAPGAPFAFSVKFIKAGSYFYGCLYHDNSRMTGTITVTP